RVRRRRWPQWSCGRRGWLPIRGWPECGRQGAGHRHEPRREAGHAVGYTAERGFQAEGVQEALSLTQGPILAAIGLPQEPFCLFHASLASSESPQSACYPDGRARAKPGAERKILARPI